MLAGILCFVAVIAFLIGYEYLKNQKPETQAAVKISLFLLGVIFVGCILASGNKNNDIYSPGYSNITVDTTTVQPVSTVAPTYTPDTFVATTVDTQTIEPAPEIDPVLESLANAKEIVRQRLIDAISDVDNYDEYKIRKLQEQLSGINREIDRYNNKDAALSQSNYRDPNLVMDEQIRLQKARINSSSTYYNDPIDNYTRTSMYRNDQINTYTPSTVYCTPTTYTPSTYTSITTYPSTYTPTTFYQPTYTSSTYVNPNANSNTVQVSGYYRSNGIHVAPHIRTAPNSTKVDNFSYRP